jgi:hypothetical protein
MVHEAVMKPVLDCYIEHHLIMGTEGIDMKEILTNVK